MCNKLPNCTYVAVGWAAGESENMANSVQFQLKLPVGTELSNSMISKTNFQIIIISTSKCLKS